MRFATGLCAILLSSFISTGDRILDLNKFQMISMSYPYIKETILVRLHLRHSSYSNYAIVTPTWGIFLLHQCLIHTGIRWAHINAPIHFNAGGLTPINNDENTS